MTRLQIRQQNFEFSQFKVAKLNTLPSSWLTLHDHHFKSANFRLKFLSKTRAKDQTFQSQSHHLALNKMFADRMQKLTNNSIYKTSALVFTMQISSFEIIFDYFWKITLFCDKSNFLVTLLLHLAACDNSEIQKEPPLSQTIPKMREIAVNDLTGPEFFRIIQRFIQ